jgi:hypothetical protein
MAGARARRLHKSTRAAVACGACLPARAAPSSRARRTLRTSLVSLRLGQASSLSASLPPAPPPRPSTGPGDPDPSESTGCPATPNHAYHGSLFKQTPVIGFRFALCAAASAPVFRLGPACFSRLLLVACAVYGTHPCRQARALRRPGPGRRVASRERHGPLSSGRFDLQLGACTSHCIPKRSQRNQQRPSRHGGEASHCVRGFKGQPLTAGSLQQIYSTVRDRQRSKPNSRL